MPHSPRRGFGSRVLLRCWRAEEPGTLEEQHSSLTQSPRKDLRQPQNIPLAGERPAASPRPDCISPRSERHCCPSTL